MKILALSAAALAALTALPAAAQSGSPQMTADTEDAGDWWWIDVTGSGAKESVMLVDGEGKRRGDRVELNSTLIYRTPQSGGAVGGSVTLVIDCKGKTQRTILRSLLYTEMRMTALPSVDMGKQPINPGTAMYRFACTADREFATHFGPGSRRAAAAAIFDKYPE